MQINFPHGSARSKQGGHPPLNITLLYYSSFHFLFHYPNISPILPQFYPNTLNPFAVLSVGYFSLGGGTAGADASRSECKLRRPLRQHPRTLKLHKDCIRIMWGFPKIRGTLLGVPRIRTIVFWDLYWGPLILENYHVRIETKYFSLRLSLECSDAWPIVKVHAGKSATPFVLAAMQSPSLEHGAYPTFSLHHLRFQSVAHSAEPGPKLLHSAASIINN